MLFGEHPMKRLAYLDQLLFKKIVTFSSNINNSKGISFFKWISKTGDGHLYFVLSAVLFYFDTTHGVLFFYTALLAYTCEIPIYLLLKNTCKRQRPLTLLIELDSIIIPSDKFSLPSGHTAAAFLMATIVAYFYPSISVFAFAWASLIGLSRIVLRVHYPLDVLIGMTLGIILACTSILLLG